MAKEEAERTLKVLKKQIKDKETEKLKRFDEKVGALQKELLAKKAARREAEEKYLASMRRLAAQKSASKM